MLKLSVASPCTEKWESMRGDDRKRHCDRCGLDVHDVKELSEAQVTALFSTGGRVCGRIFQRADGTVLTRDCPVGLARVRRNFVVAVTASLALLVGAFAVRPASGLAAPSSAGGWSAFTARLAVDRANAETWLRGTRTFGPLIEWLDPAPLRAMAGDMVMVAPGAGSTGP
jgi:hypothetical protein